MIVMVECSNLQMNEVLANLLGLLPLTLAKPDGTLRKTSLLGKGAPEEFTSHRCLIDGMALVQRLKGAQKTFAEIAEFLLSMALNKGTLSDTIDVLFDDNRDDSIKNAERESGGEGSGSEFRYLQTDHRVKQWRKFLYSSRNKQALIVFVTKE